MPDDARTAVARSSLLVNLPNAITFARLCAVPMAVWLVLHHDFLPAFWLFLAAGVSDAVDGWLARRVGPSYFGALLDPVADKALLMAMFIMLAVVHVLPDWLAILVVFRDVVIVGGVLVLALLGQPPAIRPLRISKLNTVLQIVVVAAALLLAGLARDPGWLLWGLIWLAAASTFASGVAYVVTVMRP